MTPIPSCPHSDTKTTVRLDPVVRRLLMMVVLALAGAVCGAESVPLSNTEVRVLPTSANGRSYTLHIGLPASYAASPSRKYPVVYSCDGYWDFPLFVASGGNLQYDGAIPDCIFVGIAYSGTSPDVGSLRSLDDTPLDTYNDPGRVSTGYAKEFLDVITAEFIPFVESHYRVDTTFRVLTGSSYGGLFTTYALLQRPGLFQ